MKQINFFDHKPLYLKIIYRSPISKLEYRMVLLRGYYCFPFHICICKSRSSNPIDLVTSHKFNKDAIVTDIIEIRKWLIAKLSDAFSHRIPSILQWRIAPENKTTTITLLFFYCLHNAGKLIVAFTLFANLLLVVVLMVSDDCAPVLFTIDLLIFYDGVYDVGSVRVSLNQSLLLRKINRL